MSQGPFPHHIFKIGAAIQVTQTPIKSIEKAKGFLQTQQWSMQPRPPPQPQTCSAKHRTQRAMQHSPSSYKDYLLDLSISNLSHIHFLKTLKISLCKHMSNFKYISKYSLIFLQFNFLYISKVLS